MATKAEVKQKLRPRVEGKVRKEFAWVDLVAAVQSGTTQDRSKIVMGVRNGSAQQVGRVILMLCRDRIKTTADVELDSILADDAIDLAEFDRVL